MDVLLIVIVIFLLLTVLSLCVWYHPNLLFYPINTVYRTDSSPRTNFYSPSDKNRIFPAGEILESQWQDIRREGRQLYESLHDKQMNYLNQYNIDIGAESKKDWTTIPLRLFGLDSGKYMSKCPITAEILKSHSEIKSCLFSFMSPGKVIEPHTCPYDGILRYQLALEIPRGECYLHVGGERYNWVEGEGVMFDEANIHGAVNKTDEIRVVLLIDIERPYSFLPYRIMNKTIIKGMGLLPATKQATLL